MFSAPPPTLVSDLPCFSQQTGGRVAGTGWTPGGKVRLRAHYISGSGGDVLDKTVTADSDGRIEFAGAVSNDEPVSRHVEMVAEDETRTAQGAPDAERLASTRFTLSWYGPFFRPWNTNGPARGRPGHVATLTASGYINDGPRDLYAHYLLRGRVVRTVRVGHLKGDCAALKVRMREFPFHPVPRGTYTITFDTTPYGSDDAWDSPGYKRVVVR